MTDIPKMTKAQRVAFLALRPDGQPELHVGEMAGKISNLARRHPELVEETWRAGWQCWNLTAEGIRVRREGGE